MKEIEINNPTIGYVCEYCGYTYTDRDAYYSIQSHEQKCGKNPRNIAIAKNAVGKIYRDSSYGILIKVLKFNEDYIPRKPMPIVRDGFMPVPTVMIPTSEQYPLYIQEIKFNSHTGMTRSVSILETWSEFIDFSEMIEATPAEWDDALKRIADAFRTCNDVTD